MLLHWYQVKLKGPVPEGLAALRVPTWLPVALHSIKTGSLTPGSDGYDVNRIALDPGANSCASNDNGIMRKAIEPQKRTGKLKLNYKRTNLPFWCMYISTILIKTDDK